MGLLDSVLGAVLGGGQQQQTPATGGAAMGGLEQSRDRALIRDKVVGDAAAA